MPNDAKSTAAFISVLAAIVAIASPFIIIGQLSADIGANAKHREAWKNIDPEASKSLPDRQARIETKLDLLMAHFDLKPKE